MENLVQLQNRDGVGSRGAFWLNELFRIKRFAHENMQDLAGARGAIPSDLRFVDIEFGFAVAPIIIVLD